MAGSTLKDETERIVYRSEPHFTNPTKVVAPRGEGTVFLSRNWKFGKPDLTKTGDDTITASKRNKPRQLINVSMFGDTSRRVEETVVEDESVAPEKISRMARETFEDDEVTPEIYEQAACGVNRCTTNEIMKNRGCWRVVDAPDGVRLIKSRYVFKIKRIGPGRLRSGSQD